MNYFNIYNIFIILMNFIHFNEGYMDLRLFSLQNRWFWAFLDYEGFS